MITTRGAVSLNTRIDLPERTRTDVCALLSNLLADAINLGLQARQAHWNVRGPHFSELHALFGSIAQAVEAAVDLIAERVVQLGGQARGTLETVVERTTLAPYPPDISDARSHLTALATGLSGFGKSVRRDLVVCADLGDPVTADLLTGACRETEKHLWMVESHLRGDD